MQDLYARVRGLGHAPRAPDPSTNRGLHRRNSNDSVAGKKARPSWTDYHQYRTGVWRRLNQPEAAPGSAGGGAAAVVPTGPEGGGGPSAASLGAGLHTSVAAGAVVVVDADGGEAESGGILTHASKPMRPEVERIMRAIVWWIAKLRTVIGGKRPLVSVIGGN